LPQCTAEWICVSFTKLKVRLTIFIISLLPFIRLIWQGYRGELGANPIEFITRSTGTWALAFLCITLTISPLQYFFKQLQLIRFRRMLGLFAFFYAFLHVMTWIGIDHQGNWVSITNDLIKRAYLTIGLLTFALLLPLALTSNKFSQRRLGRKWKKLHRLIYAVAILAILHYWLHKAGKNDFQTVSIYALVVGILLGWRVLFTLKKLKN